ncbi:MAG: arsenical-resistance protein, partial [Rhodospirillaceae bacterium]|nr:arsenical-resistance protein [Rhodospirillaceae bacterium]
MTPFEKYLTIWVALSIIMGITLGELFPAVFLLFATLEYANVNILIAILIWAMVYPMMVSVNFKTLHRVAEEPKGLFITCIANWILKPFTMAFLGVVFFKWLFSDVMSEQDANSYLAGLI